MQKIVLFCLLGILTSSVIGQTRNVTGVVTSNLDGKGIPEVVIRVKGALVTVQSDNEGKFLVPVPENTSDILTFSHPDFDDIEISLNGKTQIDIIMQSNVRYNQYGARVNRTPLSVEERNGILVFESADQSYRAWFDARVQVDGGFFFGDVMNDIGNGYSIRRARFAIKTEFSNSWYGEFDMDISNSELELKDAYLQYTFNNGLELKVGNYKEGFSMESTTTSRYLTFQERPMAVNAFAPSRHIGLAATYQRNWLLFIGGIHFQKVDDLEERIFSKDNNKDFGMDEGYSLTGRLVFNPFYKDLEKGLHFGLAGSYRTPKTDAEVAGTLRYDTRSLSSINRKKYIDTDLMGNIDYATLGGLEFAGYYKNLRFQSEYLMSDVHRTEGLPTEKFDGWYAFGSVILFGGRYQYNLPEGEFTQIKRGRSWGDFELAFRYDYLSLNSHMDQIMGGSGEGYTLGLNYYANNNVKIMLNYAFINHDRYASGKNKLFVGYDAEGNLTRNPKLVVDEMGKAGEDYHMLSVRFEIAF